MKKENDAVNSKPGNRAAGGIPIQLYFAEKLIINEIIGEMPETHMPAVAWTIKKRNLLIFIREYCIKHGSLPVGCHNLGSASTFGSFAEAIDFDAVKQKIHDAMEYKYYQNRQAWNEGSVKSDFKPRKKGTALFY